MFLNSEVNATVSSIRKFSYNKAGYGGSFYNYRGQLSFNAIATFENNTSEKHGGAIFNWGTLNFTNTIKFLGNKSATEGGGALYTQDGTATFSYAATFTGNAVSSSLNGHGGGMQVGPAGIAIFNAAATFENNQSNSWGGAISSKDTSVLVFNSTASFTDNIATASGGAMFGSGGLAFNGAATFERNKAGMYGGGIYNQSGTVTFSSTATFTNNTANNHGGGIVNHGAMEFKNTATFSSNKSATNGGGGLYTQGSVIFTNTAPATFTGNQAANHGGGLAVGTGGSAVFNTSTAFNNNSSTYGGAVHAGEVVTFNSSSSFTNNAASSQGGMAYNGNGYLHFVNQYPTNSGNTGGVYNRTYTYCKVGAETRQNCCPPGTNWNGSTCVTCTGGQVWNGTACACPADKPNWNGSSCAACASGSYWNGSTCVTCTGGQVWNSTTLTCVCPDGQAYADGSCMACASVTMLVPVWVCTSTSTGKDGVTCTAGHYNFPTTVQKCTGTGKSQSCSMVSNKTTENLVLGSAYPGYPASVTKYSTPLSTDVACTGTTFCGVPCVNSKAKLCVYGSVGQRTSYCGGSTPGTSYSIISNACRASGIYVNIIRQHTIHPYGMCND